MLKARQVWQVVLIMALCLSSFPGASVAPASAQITGVEAPAPSPNVSVTPVAALPFTSPVSTPRPTPVVTSTPTPQATVTPGVTETVGLTVTQGMIGRGGGRLWAANGRIQLDVPAGLFARITRVSITPRRLNANRDANGPRWQFDLDAFDVLSETDVITFEQPLTLTVDVRGLIDHSTLNPAEHLVLMRKTDSPDAPWSELMDVVEITPGILQVPLQHFSGYGLDSTGNESNGWQLKYNPPVASLFSGAATFNYPIEVPPGQGGLTPDVSLAYSTRSLDGLVSLNQDDTDGLPPGWSLDVASIARVGTKPDKYQGAIFTNTFALTLKGAGHDLEPVEKTQTFGRYYAVDAPSLYVERRNDSGWNGSPLNESHEYWIVKTGEGTTYRLGYNSDSEQTVTGGWCTGYCGLKTATRWRVDEITDMYGNRIALAYFTHATSSGITSEHTRLSSIDYNFINSGGSVTSTARIELSNSTGAYNWINQIRVYNAGITNKIREYQIGLAYDTSANMHTELTSLTQHNGAGTQHLPATTFTYAALPHAPQVYLEDSYVPDIPYATRINNGYGGATEFSYLSDYRSEWKERDREGGWIIWEYGYSYVVTETRTYDGITASPARVQYGYGTRCYDQTGGPFSGPLTLCQGRNPDEFGPLVGHDSVIRTTLALDGSVVSREVHNYTIAPNNSPFRGREYATKTFGPIDLVRPVIQITSTYAYVTTPITFTFLQSTETTSIDGDISATQQVTYTYDSWGNIVETFELGDMGAAADDRKTTSSFPVTTTVTNIPTVTWWPRSGAVASSQMAGFEASRVHDGIIASETGWSSTNVGRYGSATITVSLDAAHAVDLIQLYPFVWAGTVSGFPRQLKIYANGSLQKTVSFSTPGIGSVYVALDTPVSTSQIILVASQVGAFEGGGYGFSLAEVWFGKLPGPNTGRWIVSQPGYTNVYTRVSATQPFTLAKSTWYTYDNRPQFYLPPITGTLTAVRAWTGTYPPQFIDTRYTYDQWGNRLTATTFDDLGTGSAFATLNPVTTTTTFDGLYHLHPVQLTNPKNQTVQTTYDYALGVPITVTDANGAVTTYQYDTFGRLLKVIRPGDTAADPSVQYGYSDVVNGSPFWVAPFRISESRKPLSGGPGVRHFYDGLGREIQTQSPVSVTVSGSAAPVDILVTRRYDARGLLISQTVPYTVPAYVYNAQIKPYTTTNLATAPKTLTQYDALGRVITTTAPDGTATRFVYENIVDAGRTLTVKNVFDANRHRVQYRSDANGQLVKVLELSGNCSPSNWPDTSFGCGGSNSITWTVYATTQYGYDPLGNLRIVTDALTNTTVITYDALGRKTAMVDPDMGKWTYAYDTAGNLITQTDAKGQTITFTYDALNRLTGKSTGVAYTYDGTSTSTYTSGGERTIHTSDGKTLRSLGPTDITFALNVGSDGAQALSIKLQNDTHTSNVNGYSSTVQVLVDGVTKGTITVNGGIGPELKEYPGWLAGPTAVGEFAVNLGEGSHTLTLHRIGGTGWVEVLQDGSGILFNNTVGQRTSMSDPSGYATWAYDSRGRVVTETKAITVGTTANVFTTQYGYDSLDRVLTTTYPTNEVVTQTYNAMGALENMKSASVGAPYLGQWYAKNLDYNANGALTLLQLGNNLSTTYSYFPLNFRLQRLQIDNVQAFNYGYDNVGNVLTLTTRITQSNPLTETVAFKYDALDRLTNAISVTNGYTGTYGYNEIGNLITKTESVTPIVYAYGGGQPHAVKSLSNGNGYQYDANGNMTQRLEISGTAFITYTQRWDAENRLTQVDNTVTMPCGNCGKGLGATTIYTPVAKFVYDGDGARVMQVQISGTQIITTVYAGALEVMITPTQRITKTYYRAGSQLIAMRQYTTPTTSVLYFLHSDHLGSTSLTTCGEINGCSNNVPLGGVVSRQLYDAWGNVRQRGNLPTDIGYTGQRDDSYIKLVQMGARWYDPTSGRWLSPDTIVPDPANPQAWNRYAYVYNSPLNFIDPSGHKPICDLDDPCIDPISWDQNAIENTTATERRDAESAYYDFLADPAKYLSYMMNPSTIAEHPEYNALSIYTEGVENMPVEDFILGNFSEPPPEVSELTSSEAAYAAQLDQWPAALGAAAPVGGVYALRNSDKIIMYIGRTDDLARRLIEHQKVYPNLKFDPLIRSNSYNVQRGVEQLLYDKYQPPLNKIRPISLRNGNIKTYLRAGRSFLFGGGRKDNK